MKFDAVSAKRLIKWSAAMLVWVLVSWIGFIYTLGGKRQESWCNHQGAPADWVVSNGELIRTDGPPAVLRCEWDTPSGEKSVNYELWPLTVLDAINTVLWCSIPEILLWAVWLAWNKRRPVPTPVTRVFQIISALWVLVIVRELGYSLHYLH